RGLPAAGRRGRPARRDPVSRRAHHHPGRCAGGRRPDPPPAPRGGGGARPIGLPPQVGALLVQAAGLALLACAPWTGAAGRAERAGPTGKTGTRWWERLAGSSQDAGTAAQPSPAVPGAATAAAAVAAATAALVIIGWALAGESIDRPVVAVVAGTTLLALALRALGLLRRENSAVWIWHESRQRFRELADRTTDVVLLCDLSGVIRY